MSFSNFVPASSSALELFRSHPVDIGIESVSHTECRQNGNVSLTPQIDIDFESNGRQMIYLDETKLNIRFRVEGKDGAHVNPIVWKNDGVTIETPPTPVSVVNNAIHSFFEGVEFSINSKTVYSSRAHAFSHKNFLEIMRNLQYEQMSKQDQMMYLDYPPHFVTNLAIRGGNMGLARRTDEILHGNSVHCSGPLGLGIARTQTFMPPGTKCKLSLIRASDEYIILSNKPEEARDFKVIFEDIWLDVCLVTVPQAVYDGMLTTMTKMPAIYLYQETDVKEISYPANNRLPAET